MLLFFKGIIIGLGKVIPGVSGSLLAIRLNVYEDIISSINNIFNNFKDNVFYLFKVGLGILISIVFGSNIIMYCLNNYRTITMTIFLLLILSGVPMIIKQANNYYIAFITFIVYMLILFVPKLEIFHNYFFIGFIEAFTTIVPGISGTALFMSLGLYEDYLSMFSNIYLFEFNKLIPFSLGLLIGALIIVRFINYCFRKYRDKTYSAILGLLIGSIVLMIIKR